MIKNLLFDLDGTLTDPKIGITSCLIYALEKLGLPAPSVAELLWCIGPPLHQSFLKIIGDPEKVPIAVRYYRERYHSDGMYENQAYVGIHEMLMVLKDSGFNLFLATSKLDTAAELIIDHFKFRSYFTRVYGSLLDGTRSDKAELIEFILRQEKLPPAQSLMIGDREFDIIGASKNGVRGLGVAWGYGSEEELHGSGAEVVVQTPLELQKYLLTLLKN